MTTLLEASRMALEALEADEQDMVADKDGHMVFRVDVAITALRQAIEQAEHVHAVNTSQENVDETAERKHMTDLASVGEVGVWGEREWFDCTDEQLIAEVRRRGFVIRDAQIEQSEQEPVLWLKTWSDGSVSVLKTKSHAFADRELEPLYSAPPPRQPWVGLTAEEIWQCNTAPAGHHVECHICVAHQNVLDFAEAIEAKLKEKNKW